MPATYDALMRLREENVPYRYEERDSQLYAVSIGMGRDPLNEAELHYLYENYPLRVVPTQAVVVARQKLIWDGGLNIGQFLHGEQRLTLHRPLPPAASCWPAPGFRRSTIKVRERVAFCKSKAW